MKLNLYRRHLRGKRDKKHTRTGCLGGHKPDSRNGAFEERQKGWKKCECAIFASGKIDGKFRRRSTDEHDWEKARAVAESWIKNDLGKR